jgi:hypothetical protein
MRQSVDGCRKYDETRTNATAFVGLQVERLGAEQTDLTIEPGEVDGTSGFNQDAGDVNGSDEFIGE